MWGPVKVKPNLPSRLKLIAAERIVLPDIFRAFRVFRGHYLPATLLELKTPACFYDSC